MVIDKSILSKLYDWKEIYRDIHRLFLSYSVVYSEQSPRLFDMGSKKGESVGMTFNELLYDYINRSDNDIFEQLNEHQGRGLRLDGSNPQRIVTVRINNDSFRILYNYDGVWGEDEQWLYYYRDKSSGDGFKYSLIDVSGERLSDALVSHIPFLGSIYTSIGTQRLDFSKDGESGPEYVIVAKGMGYDLRIGISPSGLSSYEGSYGSDRLGTEAFLSSVIHNALYLEKLGLSYEYV
jgi:hypothetical protein